MFNYQRVTIEHGCCTFEEWDSDIMSLSENGGLTPQSWYLTHRENE
jgi:hypothetical protein